ncbi:MAG: DNA polymerase III subunit beta [Spirochaetaceae bacterium]|nr:MAG: DNA polymerase III subunit beta [Spirochaetaceae bacterium]
MKFTCENEILTREIITAQEIISSRNSLSILSNVFLETSGNTLTIKATDLKVSFETQIPIGSGVDGTTTVYCEKLLGILRTLPSGEVEFESDSDSRFLIRPLFKKIEFKLKCIAAEKYPEVQVASTDAYFEIPQKDLLEMISQTIFAISDDETRYYMNGVFLENTDGKLVMVATDGRRLSLIAKSPENPVIEFPGIIIPPKVLALIRKLASGEGLIKIAVTEKSIFFEFDNQKISSALIEAQFPNYQRVIPQNQDHSAVVKKNDLFEALRRVSLLVEKSRRVYVQLSNDVMTIKSDESELGVATEEISCAYTGPETTLALNFQYLVDPLRVMDSDDVTIMFTEPSKAVSLNSVPEKEYFHIVMPMQLN